jgi:hypothetical protein
MAPGRKLHEEGLVAKDAEETAALMEELERPKPKPKAKSEPKPKREYRPC